jgi:hypothetical protein
MTSPADRAAERAADREANRVHESPRTAAPEAAPLDRTDPRVAAWLATTQGLPADEVTTHTAVLAAFCTWCGETPAELVERIFDRVEYRYLRRTHYQEQILEFSTAGGGSWEEQTARGDVVRAFFLANGHRIKPARVPWQVWAQLP